MDNGVNKNNDTGCVVAAVILAAIILAILGFMDSFAGPSYKGIKGVLSGDWNHAKCILKPCDEDGHCPVWADKYGKCYMLDSLGAEVLKDFQSSGVSKANFEILLK